MIIVFLQFRFYLSYPVLACFHKTIKTALKQMTLESSTKHKYLNQHLEMQISCWKRILSLPLKCKLFDTQCTFAHSDSEIRDKIHISQKYKTKVCYNFSIKGFCSYGSRCHYLHLATQEEDDGLKTRSNSEESDSSKSCRSEKNNKLWSKMTHNKRIELIQNLGFDYSIRYSYR